MVVIELVGLIICVVLWVYWVPEYSDIDMSGEHHMYNMVQMSWETWLLSFYLIGWMATGCKNSHTKEDLTSCGRIMPGWYVKSWDHQPGGGVWGLSSRNVTPDIVCLDSLTVTTQRTFRLTEYSMLYWKSSSYVIHDVIGESIVHYSNISHINIADRQHITGRPACPISDYHMAGRTGLFSELVLC